MNIETKPAGAPAAASPPLPDFPALAQEAAPILDALERAASAVRRRLGEAQATLDLQIQELEQFALGQPPPGGAQLVAREARLAEERLATLETALAEARAVAGRHAGVLAAARDTLAARRGSLAVLADVDLVEALEGHLAAAALQHERLAKLIGLVEAWWPVAVASGGRLAQAALYVVRRRHVEDVSTRLERLREQVAAARENPAADGEALETLRKMERRLGRPLPVPALRWPAGGDAFTGPVLEEPRA